MRRSVIRLLATAVLASLMLAPLGGAAKPQDRPAQWAAQRLQEDQAKRAENELCRRWKPKLKQLQKMGFTSNGAVRLTERLQPNWIVQPASRYRDVLVEWMFLYERRSDKPKSWTREEAARRVAGLIAEGRIRLWQARVKFHRLKSPQLVTRIGTLAVGEGRLSEPAKKIRFNRGSFNYIISKNALSVADVNEYMARANVYLFFDKTYGYFLEPITPDILSYLPGNPPLSRPVFSGICYQM